ncbi:unnamed protein product, partial [Rotaria sp. Silwood1]
MLCLRANGGEASLTKPCLILSKLSTQYPISGSFSTYGSRFVDEAFGFALGYNYILL